MKAKFEKIQPNVGSSFSLKAFAFPSLCESTYWHFHPEYEIVYIHNGQGERRVGHHISQYENGDLVFLGPNLAHTAFSNGMYPDNQEIVLQMKADFLGESFFEIPEMKKVATLFQRSSQGIVFFGETKAAVGERLQQMVTMDNFNKLIHLLQLLQELAWTNEYQLLNAHSPTLEFSQNDYDRVEQVYRYVAERYNRDINLEEVAQLTNMTIPAFCRFFKKVTHKTFISFLNEYRIARACELLTEKRLSVSEAGYQCGFNNLSHFNKQFRKIINMKPSDYRKKFVSTVGTD